MTATELLEDNVVTKYLPPPDVADIQQEAEGAQDG
jgi:hypothetical protein